MICWENTARVVGVRFIYPSSDTRNVFCSVCQMWPNSWVTRASACHPIHSNRPACYR